MIVLPLVGEIS